MEPKYIVINTETHFTPIVLKSSSPVCKSSFDRVEDSFDRFLNKRTSKALLDFNSFQEKFNLRLNH